MGKVSETEAPSSSAILGDDKFEHQVADWLLGRRRKKTSIEAIMSESVEEGTAAVG